MMSLFPLLRVSIMRGQQASVRLRQIQMILQSKPPMNIVRPFSVSSRGSSAHDYGDFFKKIFSDIDSNHTTSEANCTEFMRFYTTLPLEQKGAFLSSLAQTNGMDKSNFLNIARIIAATKNQDEPTLLTAAERMRTALRPKHKMLFQHIGQRSGGVKFLVDLRGDILNLKQSNLDEMSGALYQELNSTLRELLLVWFTVGFLNLERITWNSSCDLVQKVSQYEAVHPIRTWADIKQRVGPYRRCYIFTHNSMPREPVVVLHTALTKTISSSIQSIIHNARFRPSLSPLSAESHLAAIGASADNRVSHSTSASTLASTSTSTNTDTKPSSSLTTVNHSLPSTSAPSSPQTNILASFSANEEKEDPAQIQCAVFYSITSTQKGLQGIEMGNYLIKSVVRKLLEEFPHLSQFSSLSPIPGFRDWLLAQAKHNISVRDIGEDPGLPMLLPHEASSLAPFQQASHVSTLDTFKDAVASHEWYRNPNLMQIMSAPLQRLCAHYLYDQKRRNYALNPVAHFHLSNGAQLWRINFLADTSHRGLVQSCSMMVNYRYFLDSTETNSRNYLERKQISVSQQVLNLLQGDDAKC